MNPSRLRPILKMIGLTCTALAMLALSASCSGQNAVPNGIPQQAQGNPAAAAAHTHARPPTEADFEGWHAMLMRFPKPSRCVVATYPEIRWRSMRCTKAPNIPFRPRHGIRRDTVGNGTDWSELTSGYTTFARGSFHDITGLTSEEDFGNANDYSLQLNTDFFTTATCAALGSANPACRGWEQFLYTTSGTSPAFVFIQYWLINFSAVCPAGWNTYGVDCWTNSASSSTAPAEAITNLLNVRLSGNAGLGSVTDDFVEFTVCCYTIYATEGSNWFPDLYRQWQASEFNVIGNGGGSEAVFNSGATIVVRTEADSDTLAAPQCDFAGFTGETNNLYLTGEVTNWPKSQFPSVTFTETDNAHSSPSCVAEGAL
jgi:hypothetical protein